MKQKKKLAFIHYSSPPIIGGVEFVIESQIKFLIQRGFPVKLIVGAGESFHPLLEFITIPEIYSLHPRARRVQEELKKGKMKGFLQFKDYLKKKLSGYLSDVELVIAHNIFTMPFNIALTAACHELSVRKKFIVWVHDSPYLDTSYSKFLQSIPQNEYPWTLLRTFLSHVRYITVTPHIKKELSTLLNLSSNNIKVIPNGIDVYQLLNLSSEARWIIKEYKLNEKKWVGFLPARLLPRKNIEFAIEIIGEMNKCGEKTVLIISAPPDSHRENKQYLTSLRNVIRRCKLERNIIFLTEYFRRRKIYQVPFSVIRSFYLFSDFLLLTSYQESFGLPILEGGLFRLLVFAPDIPPFSQMNGEGVYLFSLKETPAKVARRLIETLLRSSSARLFTRIKKEYNLEKILEENLLPLIIEDKKIHG